MKLLNKLAVSLVMGLLFGAGAWIASAQGPLTNALNLRVKSDASGYLITSGAAYTAPDGPLTALGNLRLRTDANGYLLTTSSSSGTTNFFYAADGSATAASYTFSGDTSFNGMFRDTNALGLTGSNINFYPYGNATLGAQLDSSGRFNQPVGLAFASLGTPANGSMIYCSDCGPVTAASCPATKASCICAAAGGGSYAFRANSVWYCPF